jgi:hypothetical protein
MFGLLDGIGLALQALISRGLGVLANRRVSFEKKYDEKYGVDTDAWVYQPEMDLSARDEADGAQFYGPTPHLTLHHVFSNLPIKCNEFELIDVGSGKGRVLLVASGYPFARIIGVELSKSLAGIAQQNIVKYHRNSRRPQEWQRIEIRQTSFLDYSIPDGNLVFFLFHPFVGKMFEDCMLHIHSAALTRPNRLIYVVYVNPWINKNWLEKSGYFELVREFQVVYPTWSWSLWKPVLNPGGAGRVPSWR